MRILTVNDCEITEGMTTTLPLWLQPWKSLRWERNPWTYFAGVDMICVWLHLCTRSCRWWAGLRFNLMTNSDAHYRHQFRSDSVKKTICSVLRNWKDIGIATVRRQWNLIGNPKHVKNGPRMEAEIARQWTQRIEGHAITALSENREERMTFTPHSFISSIWVFTPSLRCESARSSKLLKTNHEISRYDMIWYDLSST
jgi:hypothetical protein